MKESCPSSYHLEQPHFTRQGADVQYTPVTPPYGHESWGIYTPIPVRYWLNVAVWGALPPTPVLLLPFHALR